MFCCATKVQSFQVLQRVVEKKVENRRKTVKNYRKKKLKNARREKS